MKNEELINALKIIHDECDSQIRCSNCPFCDNVGSCKIINALPANWNINEEIDVWRALK